ncbi:hypothetical protein [Streptomyces cavernae]|uniref:hypothetical protein n=1 Tax=Streptomyces cavernae TaxID=2259034 RepID=UPI000FEBC5C0|nr:hypothetical protein [Streptomyces cavernae]
MIRTFGFFREQSQQWGIENSDSIRDFVRPVGEKDENEIVSYLVNGADIFSEMGAEVDVLSPDGFAIAGGASLKTDGAWVWRYDLPHYVADYHLALPEEFVRRIRELDYTVPQLDENTLFSVLEEVTGIDFRNR